MKKQMTVHDRRGEILELARMGIIVVTFQKKKDGTTRVLKGTLAEKYMPQTEWAKTQAVGFSSEPDCVRIWDVEANGWRAFKPSLTNKVNARIRRTFVGPLA